MRVAATEKIMRRTTAVLVAALVGCVSAGPCVGPATPRSASANRRSSSVSRRPHSELELLMNQHDSMVGTPKAHWAKCAEELEHHRIADATLLIAETAKKQHEHRKAAALGSRAQNLFARMQAVDALGPKGVGSGGAGSGEHTTQPTRVDAFAQVPAEADGREALRVGVSRPTNGRQLAFAVLRW